MSVALAAFEDAYRLSRRADILVRIADVHERRADWHQALDALERCANVAGSSPLATRVRSRMRVIQQRLDAERSGEDRALALMALSPLHSAFGFGERRASFPSMLAPAPTLTIRFPAFIAASPPTLGGSISTGLYASSRYNEPRSCSWHCDDGRAISDRTLVTTGTILSGVAGACLGAGVVFFASEPQAAGKKTLIPAFRFRVSGEKLAMSTVWTF